VNNTKFTKIPKFLSLLENSKRYINIKHLINYASKWVGINRRGIASYINGRNYTRKNKCGSSLVREFEVHKNL
jgi:hypothetical protein